MDNSMGVVSAISLIGVIELMLRAFAYWVKNRNDKNVEAEIQGENGKIIFLIKFMKSLKRASVQDVVVNEMSIVNGETDFVLMKG